MHLNSAHFVIPSSISNPHSCSIHFKSIKNKTNTKKHLALSFFQHLFIHSNGGSKAVVSHNTFVQSAPLAIIYFNDLFIWFNTSCFWYTINTGLGPHPNSSQISCCCPQSWRFHNYCSVGSVHLCIPVSQNGASVKAQDVGLSGSEAGWSGSLGPQPQVVLSLFSHTHGTR